MAAETNRRLIGREPPPQSTSGAPVRSVPPPMSASQANLRNLHHASFAPAGDFYDGETFYAASSSRAALPRCRSGWVCLPIQSMNGENRLATLRAPIPGRYTVVAVSESLLRGNRPVRTLCGATGRRPPRQTSCLRLFSIALLPDLSRAIPSTSSTAPDLVRSGALDNHPRTSLPHHPRHHLEDDTAWLASLPCCRHAL